MDLPMGLVTALESGNCVLFVGAGAGFNAKSPSGAPAPTAAALAARLAERFNIDPGDSPDLAKIAQVIEIRKGREQLLAFLKTQLDGLEPDEHLQWLLSLTWRAVFTTNYDNLIERCYELNPDPTQTPVVIATNSEVKTFDPRFQVPIFHLHGSLFTEGGRGAVLISEQDYATFRDRRGMLFEYFRYQYATTPILYVGYSHDDQNWRMITAELRAEFATSSPPPSFRLTPRTPDLDREILASQGVSTVDGDLSLMHEAVGRTLGEIRVQPYNLSAVEASTPSELRRYFSEHPAAVSRLLNSWSYANQEDFLAAPNTSEFLKGSPPNWALVGQGLNFQRDLEEPIVNEILDFATASSPGPRSRIILGPAGYGMTTLLMAISAWSARNRAANIFHLKRDASPLLSDVEFAVTHIAGAAIFVVDNAADHSENLAIIWSRLRELGVDAFLLMGDRLNEWRQRRPAIRPREYSLDPLSDEEIDKLLERLEQLGALGRLEGLSQELRFANVKVRNSQELLVTMREVTEGRAFDAIVEDEFRGIADDVSRDLYSLVCAFSRVRGVARDTLLSEVLGVSIGDLYGTFFPQLEGIVQVDSIDDARGLNAARARHHVIANIVWLRCIDRLKREELLLAALGNLNLIYGVDVRAFEQFARDDEAVDSLQSVETKMRFFEAACRKDPTNPYVRQHYARMLRREGSFELALSQIDQAIGMNPNGRALLHTKATILRDMALESAASPDMGRRRLAQSEATFSAALRIDPQDEYSHQGQAELYLKWARAVARSLPGESVAYVAKAEEAIREGLRVVRHREGLYILSSDVERFLGDTPGTIEELEKALAEAPQSAVARYLLGTTLRRAGYVARAAEVLAEALRLYPDDPRLARAYAVTLRELERPYNEAIAVLRLAELRGMQDADFICVYGGMLTMGGEFNAAEDVWRRSREISWSVQLLNQVRYLPFGYLEGDSWLKGRIAKVGAGYAFVSVSGFPDFFCPGTKYGGVQVRADMNVEIKPGFSVRGPVVVQIRAAPGRSSAVL